MEVENLNNKHLMLKIHWIIYTVSLNLNQDLSKNEEFDINSVTMNLIWFYDEKDEKAVKHALEEDVPFFTFCVHNLTNSPERKQYKKSTIITHVD